MYCTHIISRKILKLFFRYVNIQYQKCYVLMLLGFFFFQVVSKVNAFGNSWKVNPSCADVSGVTHHDHDMPEPPECAHVFGGATSLRYEDNSSFIVNSPFKSSMDYR